MGREEHPWLSHVVPVGVRAGVLEWEVIRSWLGEFKYRKDTIVVCIPEGFRCDLASVPAFLWGIYPPWGKYTMASILHDWLYSTEIVSRKVADDLFYKQMRRDGVNWANAQIFYRAVRTFGWTVYATHTTEGIEAYRRLGGTCREWIAEARGAPPCKHGRPSYCTLPIDFFENSTLGGIEKQDG